MPPDSTPPLRLEVTLPADHNALLAGLESWLQLGLISDEYVKRVCQTALSCPLPSPERVSPEPEQTPVRQARSPRRPPATPSRLRQQVTALFTEISVIWLLVLGVFMVVVSSGVLAASQWQSVTAIGQAAILLSYTVAFWLAARWASSRPNLQRTAEMLRVTTLLLVPINIWLMDGLRIYAQGWGWLVTAIASVGLAAILLQLWRSSSVPAAIPLVYVGVSLLQWGWQIPQWPLVATYMGAFSALAVLLRRRSSGSARLPGITLAIATALLLVRAVAVADLPLSQFGLVLAGSGMLIQRRFGTAGRRIGICLLVLGWLISVGATPPLQAIVITLIAAWLFVEQIHSASSFRAVTLLFLTGLQGCWLLWRLVPAPTQQALLQAIEPIAGSGLQIPALAGVGLFPYLLVGLGLTGWLDRRFSTEETPSPLARHAEQLTLILGGGLTLISLTHPFTAALNLTASTLLLWRAKTRGPDTSLKLVLLTQILGIGAIAAWVDWRFPTLSMAGWAGLTLGLAIAGLLVSNAQPQWRQSAWHLGLGLAGLSYLLWAGSEVLAPGQWAGLWLAVPIVLMGLSFYPRFQHQRWASWLSTGAFVVAQALIISHPIPRLVALGLATAGVGANSVGLRHPIPPVLTLGLGLSWLCAAVWQVANTRLTNIGWLIVLAIAIWGLWLLCARLTGKADALLARYYSRAADGWASVLMAGTGLALTGITLDRFSRMESPAQAGALALASILSGAIAYRLRQQQTEVGYLGLAWMVELAIALAVMQFSPVTDWPLHLAIATLALALTTQLAGDWVAHRRQQPHRPSWHVVPLAQAGLAVVLGHVSFGALTGLFTVGLALVGVGVGRRNPAFSLQTVISLLIGSVGLYELLIYQLLRTTPSGYIGDGILALAILGAVLSLVYGLLALRPMSYVRLSAPPLQAIASVHWMFSLTLALVAYVMPLSPTAQTIWVGVMAGLTAIAIWKGRKHERWVYIGIATLLITGGAFLDLVLPDAFPISEWAGAIVAPLGVMMHGLPWRRWGWRPRPWRRAALIVPGLVLFISASVAKIPSILIVAAAYAWLAKLREQSRLSYVSLALANWAVFSWMDKLYVREPIWYSIIVAASILFITEVDPGLRSPAEREKRHLLRCLAVALVCLTVIYQSEFSPFIAAFTLALAITLVLAGLVFRVRAYLYVGTLTFVIQVVRQLWLLVSQYSLLIWAIGIVLGLIFIWVAATFEARRSQVNALMQTWFSELAEWE